MAQLPKNIISNTETERAVAFLLPAETLTHFTHVLRVTQRSTSCSQTESNEEGVCFLDDMSSCVLKSRSRKSVAAVQVDPDSDYITPRTSDLEQLFWSGTSAHYDHVSQVFPRIYIGDKKTALERPGLKDLGITHVLNAAEGKWNNVLTGVDYYGDMNIQYYGVEADDRPAFNISQYFSPAAEFIHEALSHTQNKVLVHCVMGRSRSATLVLAYLMMKHGFTVVEAIEHVWQHRCILPNQGFLKQLRALDISLQEDKVRLKKKQD